MTQDLFKVGIIGHTGRGHYGHYLDMAFVGVEGCEIVALADPDDTGRAEIQQKTGAPAAYADYREMLEKEKPDIAVLASREIGDHLELVLQTAARGAHIYLEKPIAATPAEVDQMMAACAAKDLLLVVAHPWRAHPPIQHTAIPLIRLGKIGEPRLARIYGMGGEHGGDQLFLDLYPHFFDFLWQVWGEPSGMARFYRCARPGAVPYRANYLNYLHLHQKKPRLNSDFCWKHSNMVPPHMVALHSVLIA